MNRYIILLLILSLLITTTTASTLDRFANITNIVDGDTIYVNNTEKIRLVGINTPEVGQSGYYEAKQYLSDKILDRQVYLDVDDARPEDQYGRTLAVIIINNENLNKDLLCRNYAEVMYYPPSEFNPYTWKYSCTLPTPVYPAYISYLEFGTSYTGLNGELINITNPGTNSIVMTNWTISDNGNIHTYKFPEYTLSAGKTVTIFTGSGTDNDNKLYWESGSYVWNNDGDTATLDNDTGYIIDKYPRSSDAIISNPIVKFSSNKNIYNKGEQINLTVINDGDTAINLSNSAPWWIENNTEYDIYTPIVTQQIIQINPGQSKSWIWNQKDDNGDQVAIGEYRAGISWSYNGNNNKSYTQKFRIKTVTTDDTVYAGIEDIIIGGGIIRDQKDHRSVFSILAYITKNGDARGSVIYVDNEKRLIVIGRVIDSIKISSDRKSAYITGTARINGEGEYPFEIYVENNGKYETDTSIFKISFSTYGYTSGTDKIKAGHITIFRYGDDRFKYLDNKKIDDDKKIYDNKIIKYRSDIKEVFNEENCDDNPGEHKGWYIGRGNKHIPCDRIEDVKNRIEDVKNRIEDKMKDIQ